MPSESIVGLTEYSRLERTKFPRSWLRGLSALVVGAGALGNEVVKALGLLGIGRMTVVDPDTVEASNLTRSVFFRVPEAIGRSKALAITEAARRLFPDTQSTGIDSEIADVGFQDVAQVDIIFSCVDTDLARLEIAFIATRLNRAVCDAGLDGYDSSQGRVTYFPGAGSACYCCLLSDQRRRDLLTLGESSVRSCWPSLDPSDDQSYSSTPTMAALVGALQADFGLRRLLDPPDTRAGASAVEVSLDPVPRLGVLRVHRSKTCPFHEKRIHAVAAPKPAARTTVAELLDSANEGGSCPAALVLDWPICARARCGRCGLIWEPLRRLTWFRRFGVCPRCGHRGLVGEEVIRAVARDSPWAECTLSGLGLPERHLHTIRLGGRAD